MRHEDAKVLHIILGPILASRLGALGMADETKKITPAAYLPFKTFLSSIEALEHGLPKRLDRTVWRSQSGNAQGQIMMALRFFGLLTDSDEPTPALHRLVEGKDKRQEQIAALLRHSYRSILDADLTKMTPRMLEQAMEEYNVTGDTRRKAVGFFLRAAKYADLPMHPLLLAQTRERSAIRKKRKVAPRTAASGVENSSPAPEDQSVSQSRRTIFLRGGGTVSLIIAADPFSLDTEDRQFLFELVDKIQGYKNNNPEDQEED
jgi:hypothetical protein